MIHLLISTTKPNIDIVINNISYDSYNTGILLAFEHSQYNYIIKKQSLHDLVHCLIIYLFKSPTKLQKL